VDRPALPPEAARQLEMLKVVPFETEKRSRSFVLTASLVSLPLFAGIFYMLYRLLSRHSPALAMVVLVAGAGFVLYLATAALRSRSR
jgi:threonine/homoserine/homoserine lactone efflux protein